MGLKQADPKSNEHKFALCIVKQKGYANTNGVKGKWKVLRGSTSNTQVQVVGGGEGARRTTKKKSLKSLMMLLMMRHATPPKIKRHHIGNKEHHDEPHSCCQGKK
jgi:hypothetical protein